MAHRRILSLWFPRMGAERLLRRMGDPMGAPFAVVADRGGAQVLVSLSREASAAGLSRGQGLRDAMAACPGLTTRWHSAPADTAFLAALRRWAGKFSPWVAEEAPDALIVDLTGCAHLFGGEAELLAQVEQDCADLGLSVQAGIADTVGAAWALSRYAGRRAGSSRSGDAIDMEAPATRSRAAKRRQWERGGDAPQIRDQTRPEGRIAPPGKMHGALAALPVAALRLDANTVAELGRLGLRRVDDLAGQPRAALARRFGQALVQRLDQALGTAPEPVSPAAPEVRFAVRLTLPEPIGLEADVMAAIDRLLPALCDKLRDNGRGARRVRLECHRTDHTMGVAEVGLARPAHDPDRLRPLLAMKVPEIEAGFGIDCVRIEAHVTEPVSERQHRGHAEAAEDAVARLTGTPMDDLIGRLGARVGLERITRQHPADSHIPEKEVKVLAAAWSEPATEWPRSPVPRPHLIWPSEAVTAEDTPRPPPTFRWRNRDLELIEATGPERIAPEWWLDDPAWRTGVRDYWRVTCDSGDRLWMYYAHGAGLSSGWFCQGAFA
ncbi:DNA polymerase IV [Rhodobacteraceae bacterium THAF1]|uniref:Y-family DNA polymerase n=1 Tax=Palleronia sp. THAF1 TaxID=2587842 RepID=UPI000F419760|nr:DNA polymerase Y family protein [Palleronia sp. THAF1]QFU09946.1 DNA polymerase IV [Palleronia sp. THAF1]VDC17151.1 DNA polymerase IV [Rhodobacteraceae bacterium THAF1]